MLMLSLLWLGLGVVIGGVALLARLTPAGRGGLRWLRLPALSALGALLGGWLGALLLDRIQASLVAVWVGILAVGVAALLARRRGQRGISTAE
ncbi:MAG TPA: hypothetical protein VFX31_09380 [Ktedonobacterales bacterium]|jgi:hypothetical protein|nr:hypothetical protein [Ktedonobacterales bacterium]HEX5571586.1 hypothetical protein [Ktedonobacterales bacterium]